MENALRGPVSGWALYEVLVLILVLMENALRAASYFAYRASGRRVLILVLMENALRG